MQSFNTMCNRTFQVLFAKQIRKYWKTFRACVTKKLELELEKAHANFKQRENSLSIIDFFNFNAFALENCVQNFNIV